MKKSNKKISIRKQDSNITVSATLIESAFLENLVEKLADRRYDIGYSKEKVEQGWQAIETSSIEAYVSGDIKHFENDDLIDLPFVTCFLFTCTKALGGNYNLTWATSLS
jgi:hypothetical protein